MTLVSAFQADKNLEIREINHIPRPLLRDM
jgi:hypothetical protein